MNKNKCKSKNRTVERGTEVGEWKNKTEAKSDAQVNGFITQALDFAYYYDVCQLRWDWQLAGLASKVQRKKERKRSRAQNYARGCVSCARDRGNGCGTALLLCVRCYENVTGSIEVSIEIVL